MERGATAPSVPCDGHLAAGRREALLGALSVKTEQPGHTPRALHGSSSLQMIQDPDSSDLEVVLHQVFLERDEPVLRVVGNVGK